MRNVVWKYPVQFGRMELMLPVGAKILHVAPQGGELMLWTLVDPNVGTSLRAVRVEGTGHVFNEEKVQHICTFLMDGGSLVFHAFEVEP